MQAIYADKIRAVFNKRKLPANGMMNCVEVKAALDEIAAIDSDCRQIARALHKILAREFGFITSPHAAMHSDVMRKALKKLAAQHIGLASFR